MKKPNLKVNLFQKDSLRKDFNRDLQNYLNIVRKEILDANSGEFYPHPTKEISDPGYPYFYLGEENPSYYSNRLNLDGTLHLSRLRVSIGEDEINGYTTILPGTYGVAESTEFTPGSNFKLSTDVNTQCIRLNLFDLRAPGEKTIPTRIFGIYRLPSVPLGELPILEIRHESLVLGTTTRLNLEPIYFTVSDIYITEGTLLKWLALDLDKKIVYMDAPTSGGLELTDLSAISPLSYDNINGVFSVASGYQIGTTTEVSNWNTAYGWGDHALAGYAASGHTHSGLISGLTSGYISKATATDTIGNSILYETASKIVLGGTSPRATFDVVGTQVIGLANTIGTPSGKELEIAGQINLVPVDEPTTTQVAAITLTPVDNGNLLPNTTYTYSIAYVTSVGDTRAGYRGSGWRKTITTGSNAGGYKIQIDNIPISTDPRVTGRKIYRDATGTTTGKRVTTINNNTTTSYLDNIIEASLDSSDSEYRKDNTTLKGVYYRDVNAIRIGEWNIAFMYNALQNLTTGYENTIVGMNLCGNALTTGKTNVFIGSATAPSITTGTSNIAIGYAAMMYQDASNNNIAIGDTSLRGIGTSTVKTLSNNVVVGHSAMNGCLTGQSGNVAIGGSAYLNPGGSYSTAIGYYALRQSTTRGSMHNNIALGYYVGANLHTGSNNIIIGREANTPSALEANTIVLGSPLYSTKTLLSGDVFIRAEGSLGSEIFNNPNLTSGTSWSATNDCSLTSDKATWTYSGGANSNLSQTLANFAVTPKAYTWYKFTYTVSGVTGTPVFNCRIGNTFALNETYLYVGANGTYTTYFRTAATIGTFTIYCSLTSGQAFSLDTFSLKEIVGGDLYTGRDTFITRNLGVQTFTPTAPISVGEKSAMNTTGGFMVKLTNRTGGNSVKGEVVMASHTYANAVTKIVVDEPDPIGVFYESGVADGNEAWIVVAGIAEVYFVGNTALGDYARGFLTSDGGSYVSGQALAEALPAAPFASDKHFYEIGHVLESRTGAGLAKCILHFN